MKSLINTNEPVNVTFDKYSQHFNTKMGEKHYERIGIYIDGEPILLKMDKCFSLGAKQNVDKETGEPYGWVLQICAYNEEQPTVEQSRFVETLESIIEQAKWKVRENNMQDSFNYVISEEGISRIGGCLWKGDKTGPILYARIADRKGRGLRYNTRFTKVDEIYNPTTKECITKEDVTDCCYVQAIILIDSIFVSEDKAYLSVRVYEANVQDLEERPSYL